MSLRLPRIEPADARLIELLNDRLGQIEDALARSVKVRDGKADLEGATLQNVGKSKKGTDGATLSMVDELRAALAALNGRVKRLDGGKEEQAVTSLSPEPDLEWPFVTKANPPAREWLANGDLKLTAYRANSRGYAPGYVRSAIPGVRAIGQFLGVAIYWEMNGEPRRPVSLGDSIYTGSHQSDPPDNLGEVEVVVPRGRIVAGTNYLELVSFGESKRLRWQMAQLLPSQCYWEIEITQAELDGAPGGGDTPGDVSSVTVETVDEGPLYRVRGRWTQPSPLGETTGYERELIFYSDAGGTQEYYRTYVGPVDGAEVTETLIPGQGEMGAPRDAVTRYYRLAVAPFNAQRKAGNWVLSNVGTILPWATETPGQAASVASSIQAGLDSRTFVLRGTLTPPSPLGGAVAWEAWIAFYMAETGGSAYLTNQVHDRIRIDDLVEDFGPYSRGVDYEPWAELRVKLIYADGSKSDWIIAPRAQVGKQAAPTASVTNLCSIEYDTINGKPSYRIIKSAQFSGSKDAVDWTDLRVWFYTNSGGTALDGDVDLGGIDPSIDQSWPITVTAKTDWWDRPDYAVWYKFGIRIKNSDGVAGAWVYTDLAAMSAAAGFDASGIDPAKLGDTLVLSGGKLTNYALTELAKWGLSANDFEASGGNLIIKNAVIGRLLAQTFSLTGDMYVLNSGGTTGVRINSSGVLVGGGSQYVDVTSSGVAIKGGGSENILSSGGMDIKVGGSVMVSIASSYTAITGQLQVNQSGTNYFTVAAAAIDCRVLLKAHSGFEYVAGGVTIPSGSRSDWRTAIGLTTATLNYKDHSGTDQTMTVVVLA